MPFEIAPPTRPPVSPRFTEQQALVQYPSDPVGRYLTPMLAWSLGFHVCYVVGILGWVPMTAAGIVGAVCFLRYINRFHESLHANERKAPRWHPARVLLVVAAPLYLGYRELKELHLLHHREEGSSHDPDVLLLGRDPARALLFSFLQPELSVYGYISRFGLRPRLALAMTARAAVYTALMWIGGWEGFVLFNVTVRAANTVAWFMFSWLVHGPWLWGQVRPPRFPAPLAVLWVLLVGRENLVGIRFHFLHHVFPHIPDRHLPEVSRRMII